MLVTFLVLTAGGAAVIGVAVLTVVGLLQLRFTSEPSVFGEFGLLLGLWTAVAVGAGLAWSYWSLHRAETLVLTRLKAVRVPRGEQMEMKGALKDMGLASGISPAPEPWVMPHRSVNACVLVRDGRRPRIVVTQGLLRLSATTQRAVYANLMARILSGDAEWGTAGAALMGPVFAMRDNDIDGGSDAAFKAGADIDEDPDAARGTDPDRAVAMVLGMVLYLPLVIVTEVLAQAYRADAVSVAEAADADGMLLLKDPAAMMGALTEVLPADNYIPVAGGPLGVLCFAWPGWEDAPGGGDLEMVRVGRMREVLGAAGIGLSGAASTREPDQAPTAAEVSARGALPSDGQRLSEDHV